MEFVLEKTNSDTEDRISNFRRIFDAARFVKCVSNFGQMENSQKMVVLLEDVLSPVYLKDRITDQYLWLMREIEFELEN